MRFKSTYFIMLWALVFCILGGCANQKDPRDVYEDYLAAAMTSCANATAKYCHYEREQYRQMSEESTDYFTGYEIQSWEQLSDELWVANLRFTCIYAGEAVIDATNFVGIIDGEYYVMTSIEEVPVDLLADVDIDEYTSPAEIIVIDPFSVSN